MGGGVMRSHAQLVVSLLTGLLLVLSIPVAIFAQTSEVNIGAGASITTGKGAGGNCTSNYGDVCADSRTGSGTFDGCWCDSPTYVELVSFSAKHMGDHVLIKWRTGVEIDNAGFHLWRSESIIVGYEPITQALIPAEGGPVWGGEYSYEDTAVESGTTYWYKLVAIDYSGVPAFHGPVAAFHEPVSPVPHSAWDVAKAQAATVSPGSRAMSKGVGIFAMFVPVLAAVFLLRRMREEQ